MKTMKNLLDSCHHADFLKGSGWRFGLVWVVLVIVMGMPVDGYCSREKMPSADPILRVESGMHTGIIRRMAMDAEERFIVTVGDDKTLRVWSKGEGRLLLTLRVPIGLTNEGVLYAVAVSPDGRTVAVGGQICPEWENTFCIYLIDVMAGKLRKRITHLPEAVTHLAFSPTGAYLAAVFGDQAGLWVFAIPTGAVVHKGDPYRVAANWVDFAPDGRLITSSSDGSVRLYDAHFRLLSVRQLAKFSRPYGVAFSPDGSKVAVGFGDRTTVAVLSGSDLSLLYLPDVRGVKNNLWVVAWSRDGRSLYAGGGHSEKGRYLIRWWQQAGEPDSQGSGEYLDMAASMGNVMQIVPLKAGGVVFAGADPAWGVLDHQGFSVLLKERAFMTFQGSARRLLLSEEGDTVEFDLDASGGQRGLFSVSKLLLTGNAFNSWGMQAPRFESKVMRVTGWLGESQLMLNGQALPLQEREMPQALDFDLKDRFFVLGTSYNLRMYTKEGQLRWKTPTPGAVWAVNIAGNGQLVVAAMGDGTIRWYDAMRGTERMALFVHKDQKRWVVWSPLKYFANSPGGDTLIGWQINRGKNQLADFYPVAQFPQYQRPDVFKTLLR
ncbi:MAG: hypothetical protein H7839_14555 [Magnetococcus sp. YQC-5]